MLSINLIDYTQLIKLSHSINQINNTQFIKLITLNQIETLHSINENNVANKSKGKQTAIHTERHTDTIEC